MGCCEDGKKLSNSKKTGSFLTRWMRVIFWRKTLRHRRLNYYYYYYYYYYASVVWNSTTTTDSSKLEINPKNCCFMLHQIYNGVCNYKYEDILFRLNLLTLQLRTRHLDALFLIDVFIGNICCSSILGSVSLRILSRSIRHYSTFTVNRNFKVSPSVRCVSAATAVCRSIDILNKDCTSLMDISQHFQLISSSISHI
jgi:hypothetical protein